MKACERCGWPIAYGVHGWVIEACAVGVWVGWATAQIVGRL